MAKQADTTPALQRALAAAGSLKAGTWESVEALALLAVEAQGRAEGAGLLASARATASGLKPGTWDSVRALALLARAEREIAAQEDPPA
ncbi:hypothetical protein GCM10027446_14930 [Angustibacter peucedani]